MLWTGAAAASAQNREPPPCAECIALVLDPPQAVVLREPLNELEILLRVSQRETATAAEAQRAVRSAGGVSGLLVIGIPEERIADRIVEEASRILFDITAEPFVSSAVDAVAFQLKTRFTELRAAVPSISLGVVATAAQREALLDRDLAPYVDVIAEPTRVRPRWPSAGEPYALVQAPDAWRARGGATAATRRWLWVPPGDALDAFALARDLARAMPLLVAELVPDSGVQVVCGGTPAASYLNPATLETIALAAGCAEAPVDVHPGGTPSERVVLSNGDAILRVAAAEGVFADDVRVVGARQLTVEEIVARHQAAVARQRTLVRSLISTGEMTMTFEAPGFAAPVAISSETVIYTGDGITEIEQRAIKVNGLEFSVGSGIPRLPIIEPERVASPPLTITLTDVYRYSLVGRDRVGDVACYVVSFEPIGGAAAQRTLFRGRAWLAADTFAMVKVVSVQTGLRGPIVSSEQVDEFAPHASGSWLLARSEIRQIYEGAAHRTPIHRVLTLATHDVNPPDFRDRRSAAYASPSVMLRDTPEGFRYLRRERGQDQPVVGAAAERVRTLALGVLVDPNISRPLPFAGLSYVDFDLLGTGTQVNAFFGGTYAQLAFSVPSLGGSRWQLAGRAFGIATSYNDRAFAAGREVYERNISQRPAHASVWLLRPVTPRLGVRAGYELDYTQFAATDTTAASFAVPADQVAHSIRLTLEGQRNGWTGTLWWMGSRRAGWRPWGIQAADYEPGEADYQRYGVTVTRPLVLSHSIVARIEAGWMAGRDLDRFSRYSFGTFDNRLRGYPSALIRYDRGGVLRTAAAWAVARRFRVDGFFDSAYVHDHGFGRGLRRFDGVGAAIEAPAPFGLLTAVEWGYGFQGVTTGGRRGTQVVRVSAFKIF